MAGEFERYVRHLYWKYEKEMTSFEKDVIWNCVGLSEIDHLTTEEEKSECEKLFRECYEGGETC